MLVDRQNNVVGMTPLNTSQISVRNNGLGWFTADFNFGTPGYQRVSDRPNDPELRGMLDARDSRIQPLNLFFANHSLPQNTGAQQDNRTICERTAADAQRIAGEARDAYPKATAAFTLQEFNRRFGNFTFGSYFAEGPLGFLGTPASSRDNVLGTRPYQGSSGFPTQFLDSIDPTEDAVHHFGAYFSAGLAGHKLAPDFHRADDRESNNMGDVRLADQSRRLGESLRAHPTQLSNVGDMIRRIICNGGEVPR